MTKFHRLLPLSCLPLIFYLTKHFNFIIFNYLFHQQHTEAEDIATKNITIKIKFIENLKSNYYYYFFVNVPFRRKVFFS